MTETENVRTDDLVARMVQVRTESFDASLHAEQRWRAVAEQLHTLILETSHGYHVPHYLDAGGDEVKVDLLLSETADFLLLRQHLTAAMGISDQHAAAVLRAAKVMDTTAVQEMIKLR